MNIMDLAKVVAPDCKTEIVGIHPDEKLQEIMITKGDARRTLEFDNHYIVRPDFQFWGKRFIENCEKPVADDFEYNSEINPWRLSPGEMLEVIKIFSFFSCGRKMNSR